ncbi:hypothetical protein [Vibrio hippocampi]|uniref:Glutamate-1-semialdehyde aminotransferase n=1 Tax=Vibrio hippocampi TaxID=654686 RepID=A0ABN8DHC4_9VIBR|nr:hypothetical protein [Vibrio hippocampi]CAH0527098.1 hypothetical protein VHP8226_02441 [Vibrio hippocampi]
MGCCGEKKTCKNGSKAKRKIPWFSLTIAILVVLVVLNWQG